MKPTTNKPQRLAEKMMMWKQKTMLGRVASSPRQLTLRMTSDVKRLVPELYKRGAVRKHTGDEHRAECH